MAVKAAGKKTKKKKKVLSAAEKAVAKIKRDHSGSVRKILVAIGFTRLTGVADKELTFENHTSDLDDVFVFENVIVLAEYTCSQGSAVSEHLKNKKLIYDQILAKPSGFIDYLKKRFPDAAEQFPKTYHHSKLIVKVLYCSRYDFDDVYRQNIPGPIYLDYPTIRYFLAVVEAIKRSARFEFLHFLDIKLSQVGKGGSVPPSELSRPFSGSILPEAHSNFDEGYKVVSFYADAEALLRTTYVLRRDGWRDSDNLYQRMISAKKIELIRAYLRKHKRVFINNIIVTLPSDVQPVLADKSTVKVGSLTETAPVTIMLPDRANSIGIIDGQHRIFAYHETDKDDQEIALLRVQQNLLVTGIIYPPDTKSIEREKFEAKLFLEINSNQTNAKAPLKQAIGLVIDPFTNDSIATRILIGLGKQGPLRGYIQQYFWDTDKLKTASIVSYALRPLIKTTDGSDSLFSMWTHAGKADVANGTNDEALKSYIDFCVGQINIMLGAFKSALPSEKWTADKKVKGNVISTTYINSFLIVMRMLVEKKTPFVFDPLKKQLAGFDKFPFSSYRSSQYRRMAEEIVATHFGALPASVLAARAAKAKKATAAKPSRK